MPVLFREALPLLVECVAIDTDTAMTFVTLEQLQKWGKTAEEVFTHAAGFAESARAAIETCDPSAPYPPRHRAIPASPADPRISDRGGYGRARAESMTSRACDR